MGSSAKRKICLAASPPPWSVAYAHAMRCEGGRQHTVAKLRGSYRGDISSCDWLEMPRCLLLTQSGHLVRRVIVPKVAGFD